MSSRLMVKRSKGSAKSRRNSKWTENAWDWRYLGWEVSSGKGLRSSFSWPSGIANLDESILDEMEWAGEYRSEDHSLKYCGSVLFAGVYYR